VRTRDEQTAGAPEVGEHSQPDSEPQSQPGMADILLAFRISETEVCTPSEGRRGGLVCPPQRAGGGALCAPLRGQEGGACVPPSEGGRGGLVCPPQRAGGGGRI
jgi:hypothetical protein